MERLRSSDLAGALRFVYEAAAETGPEPFPDHVLESLRALVGCEWISYCELDRVRRRGLALVEVPVPDVHIPDEDATFWRIVSDHPLCRAQADGRFDALKLSDFHTRRELRRLGVYADWFRPLGVEYELEVAIPSPAEHTKTFLFDDQRRDFTERDRALLNLLQPHLIQLYRAAAVRRVADSARIVVVDAHGSIEAPNADARRLLEAYGALASGTRPSPKVAQWLQEQQRGRPSLPLSIGGLEGTLVIDYDRRDGTDVLVLSERPARGPADLSPREHEVLGLVRDGLRNAEIAEALWVSPATVRKHLENIYEKLGVHTRTAAVARWDGGRPMSSRPDDRL